MKVVLADGMLAEAADRIFGADKALHPLDAWMGVLAFSGQIYFDFAGYSSCAIGAAACLGFVLPENFVYPYAAVGFSDFWRRWHVTLSAWLRDYLYIALGGNRSGKVRTYFNLMITMLLGGLWHGANWTFVVWGALHGLYLCVEKLILDVRSRRAAVSAGNEREVGGLHREMAPGFLRRVLPANLFLALLTFFLVNVTWVFFRAADFTTAWRLLNSMFGRVTNGLALLSTLTILKITVITVSMVSIQWMMRNTRVLSVAQRAPWWLLGIVWAGMLLLLILSQESGNSFIYFQF
jgi:D-alanyl-lipoteichoic acid acyltransferase DltB (MBOAT superfamily)